MNEKILERQSRKKAIRNGFKKGSYKPWQEKNLNEADEHGLLAIARLMNQG